MKNLNEARIYVGTYSKYNGGNLCGAWLDLSGYSNKEEFYEACKKLHKDENLDHWRDQEFLNMGEYCINYEIFLPHGTIEKIIGKKMSWENDPVEI